MISHLGRTALVKAAWALWLFLPWAGTAAGAPAPDTLRVRFSPSAFSSIDRNDALASTKAWIETVGRGRNLALVVLVDAYDSLEDLRRIVRRQSADLFIISSMDYLDLGADQARLDATFVPVQSDLTQDKYLLLTRRDRKASLPDLRGKEILLLKTVGANLSRPWMTALLKESGQGSLEGFCPRARETDKPSTAVLPVFFGQAEACVVDASSFKVMQELNPQLGTALDVCRSSPPYLETVICIHRGYTRHRADLIAGLADLHSEAAGKQILMVFKTDRLMPFDPAALASVRELRTKVDSVPGVASR